VLAGRLQGTGGAADGAGVSVETVARRTPPVVRPEPELRGRDSGRRPWLLALVGLFGVAVVYHWLQSRGHVTPAIFTDELMFAELARSVAEGEGLKVRGEAFSFPALVPVLVQAPAWLAGGAAAYGVAKSLNVVLMCLALFPAWALARLVLRPAYAFGVAAATVAGGAMLYHSYLTSEAVAYPVFLLAVGVCVRAVAEPSRRRDAAAVLVLGLAVLTRAQFVALPIAFVVAVLLVGRPVRRHAISLSALAVLAAAVLVRGRSGLGFYGGAGELEYPAIETLRWAGWTAALLPFAAGMLVVPGALLGLGYTVIKARTRAEAAFGVMTVVLLLALSLEAGLIASGEAHKPLERYAFYVVPLLFAAFFLYLERGAPRRRLYAGVALGMGGLALAVPFASLALDPFSFDSPTLSAVEALGRYAPADAASLFAAGGLLAALAAAAVPLRRWGGAVAVVSLALALAVGAAAYTGDRRMTQRTLDALAPAQRDWVDSLGIERADVLVLPGGSLHFGWMLESWNRNVGRTFHLGDVAEDPLPFTEVGIRPDGTVTDGAGTPLRSEHLVVNDSSSQIELAGERLASPLRGLTLYRTAGPLRLRSLATGVHTDRWAASVVGYRVWPIEATRGEFQVRLELPEGRLARQVELEAGPVSRRAELRPGRPLDLRIPVSGRPVPELSIRIDRADLIDAEAPRPRFVGARITRLEFVLFRGGGARLKPGTATKQQRSRK
jgi:hypothetical protein